MVDDEIINKMLEYKEEGYVGVPASAVADDDIENIIDISNLNSFDFNGDIYSSRKYAFLSNLVSLILILSVSGFTMYDWISCFMYFFLSLP